MLSKVLFPLFVLQLVLAPAFAADTSLRRCQERVEQLMKSGKQAEARDFAKRALQRFPDDYKLNYDCGRCCYHDLDHIENAVDEARRFFLRALQLRPRAGEVYYHLAELENLDGHWQKALEYSTKALTASEPDTDAYFLKAVLLCNAKKYQDALVNIDKFMAGRPEKRSLEVKAAILEGCGKFAEAAAIYRELLKAGNLDTHVYGLARCQERAGHADEAVKTLSALLARNAHDELALVTRARLYARTGKLEQSLSDFSKTLDETPSRQVYLERAAIYKRLNKLDLYKKDLQHSEDL